MTYRARCARRREETFDRPYLVTFAAYYQMMGLSVGFSRIVTAIPRERLVLRRRKRWMSR